MFERGDRSKCRAGQRHLQPDARTARIGTWRPRIRGQHPHSCEQFRRMLGHLGLSPYALARPITFVDVVYGGSTSTVLYDMLRAWIEQERQPWSVIRCNLRFAGVTSRTKTSPSTFHCHQYADWTRQLPARSVRNVSLDRYLWSYLADNQIKLNRSFRPRDRLTGIDGPDDGERARQAEPWLRALIAHPGRFTTADWCRRLSWSAGP